MSTSQVMKNENMQIYTLKFIVSTQLKTTLTAVPGGMATNIVNVKIAECRSG
ncbi:MAG: hypothetical protein KIS77_02010 [Saprospiraceae bacterium]|nr:hypothetical protein [Saprospiraceae bacterium]